MRRAGILISTKNDPVPDCKIGRKISCACGYWLAVIGKLVRCHLSLGLKGGKELFKSRFSTLHAPISFLAAALHIFGLGGGVGVGGGFGAGMNPGWFHVRMTFWTPHLWPLKRDIVPPCVPGDRMSIRVSMLGCVRDGFPLSVSCQWWNLPSVHCNPHETIFK